MLKLNQKGATNNSGLLLIMLSVALVAVLAFGGWAFSQMQNYKNNSDKMVATAVSVAETKAADAQSKKDAETAKSPLATYNGPSDFGSIVLQYPKTWSGYVDTTGGSGQAVVDGYFYPGIVPSITDTNSNFALRVQVQDQTYDQVAAGLAGTDTPPSIKAYALPKLPKVVGIMVNGNLNNGSDTPKTGTMIVLPLRDKTLEVWTEGTQFLPDFNNYVLPNLSFSP